MRIGSLNYATDQGLGILCKDFYDNEVITDFLIVTHSRGRTNHYEWYPEGTPTTPGRIDLKIAEEFIKSVDVMLFVETPFDWNLIPLCRKYGVKSVLMPMYECMPKELPHVPDNFICPSLLDLEYYPSSSTFLPIPVKQKWRLREKAITFIHNAGNLGLCGRNGTLELLQSLRYIDSPLRLIVRCQVSEIHNLVEKAGVKYDSRLTVVHDTLSHEELYSTGDVFVFPEKFNGCSLPVQEAFASGMMTMTGNRFPMNTWLPIEPLIPVERYEQSCVSQRCNLFESAVFNPKTIARNIDDWYGKDITELSTRGKTWAEANSWEVLKTMYLEALSK